MALRRGAATALHRRRVLPAGAAAQPRRLELLCGACPTFPSSTAAAFRAVTGASPRLGKQGANCLLALEGAVHSVAGAVMSDRAVLRYDELNALFGQ
jgi:hypothetical protein